MSKQNNFPNSTELRASNRRLIGRMLLVVVGMFGFGFAMVPIYSVFCDITGLNGKTGRAAEASLGYTVDPERTIRVEFISSLNQATPLEFRSTVKHMEIHPGKVYEVSYTAANRTEETLVAQAVPSVAPGAAATYFQKTECFCFTQQTFAPREQRDMPVRFVVDPALPDNINTLTLSYTFFDITAREKG